MFNIFKRSSRLLALMVTLVLCVSIININSSAMTSRNLEYEETVASALKSLNLFKGVSETDFALDRQPTRIEALVMFLRLMGAEDSVTMTTSTHPFTDVPAWAENYVAYAYQKGYTKGISADKFGSQDVAASAMYLTFVLRALGYSDTNGTDFTWSDPYVLASQVGILPINADTDNFLRGDVALVSWEALSASMKGEVESLSDNLILVGIFDSSQYSQAMTSVESFVMVDESMMVDGIQVGKYICKVDIHGFEYNVEYTPYVNLYENKSFEIRSNAGEGMPIGTGSWIVREMDDGSLIVSLTVTGGNTSWFTPEYNADIYHFLYQDGDLILTDGGMGITDVESVFTYED